MAHVIKPPHDLEFDRRLRCVFLAGSIEMGEAEDWQSQVEQGLLDSDVVILNPRRDVWDRSWEQSIAHFEFRRQVEWELDAQEMASLIAMYFAPDTKSPVTLLELGLAARGGKLIVCCPDGFWRKGNVEVVCARYAIPLVDDLSALIEALRKRLGEG